MGSSDHSYSGGKGEPGRGGVCRPRSQRSDGIVTAPQADRPAPGARTCHPLTFGFGVIIYNEDLPDVVEPSEVLDGHGAGGGLVGVVEAGADPPQERGRGRGAVQDVKVFVGAVHAGKKADGASGPGGSPAGALEPGPYVVTIMRPRTDEPLAFKRRMHSFYPTFPSKEE